MENRRYRLGATIGMVVYGLYAIPILLSEIPLLPESQRGSYIAVRLALIASALILAPLVWRYYESALLAAALGIHFIVYSLHGQWYRPLYYLSICQLAPAYAFIFQVPKKVFVPVMLVWLLGFGIVLDLRWESFIEQIQTVPFSDMLFAIIAIGLVVFILYFYFAADRAFRHRAMARFTQMGIQSSRLVHDLKGLSTAPRLYADLLREKLKLHNDSSVSEVLTHLSRDLENFQRVIMELNQLSSLRQDTVLSDFDIREAVASVKSILGNRLRGVDLTVSGDFRLHSDKALVTSILLNLFLNSLDCFNQRQTTAPSIALKASARTLTFSDNAGGFTPDILKALASRTSVSTKQTGTGVGLWFVSSTMEDLGGTVRFGNTRAGSGAEIVLHFPRKAVSSGPLPQS